MSKACDEEINSKFLFQEGFDTILYRGALDDVEVYGYNGRNMVFMMFENQSFPSQNAWSLPWDSKGQMASLHIDERQYTDLQ